MGSFGSCPDCPKGTRDVLLIAGKCKGHFNKLEGAGERDQAPNKLKDKTANTKTLNVFFKEQEKLIPAKCQNCGNKIIIPHPFPLKSAICHILPKRIFKSIQTNELNVWFGCLDCHKMFDEGGSVKVKTMKIFKLCKERIKQIFHLIAPEEIRFIPDYFLPNEPTNNTDNETGKGG